MKRTVFILTLIWLVITTATQTLAQTQNGAAQLANQSRISVLSKAGTPVPRPSVPVRYVPMPEGAERGTAYYYGLLLRLVQRRRLRLLQRQLRFKLDRQRQTKKIFHPWSRNPTPLQLQQGISTINCRLSPSGNSLFTKFSKSEKERELC